MHTTRSKQSSAELRALQAGARIIIVKLAVAVEHYPINSQSGLTPIPINISEAASVCPTMNSVH